MGKALRLELLASGHLALHLQLSIGLHLLTSRHLVLHLQLPICLHLLALRHLRLHSLLSMGLRLLRAHALLDLSLLRPCMLCLRHLRSCVLLGSSLLDPVRLHLPLVHLNCFACVDLRLATLGYGRAIDTLGALHCSASATTAAGGKRAWRKGPNLGPSTSSALESRRGNRGLERGTASAAAPAGDNLGSAPRAATSVVAARAGSGRCGDR